MKNRPHDEVGDNRSTVLIVDSDPDILNCLAERCRWLGLNVKTAADEASVIALMRQAMPDLIVIDIDFPAGEDLTLLNRLGASELMHEIPTIVLCQPSDLESDRREPDLMAYYVCKSRRTLDSIDAFVTELVDVSPDWANQKQ